MKSRGWPDAVTRSSGCPAGARAPTRSGPSAPAGTRQDRPGGAIARTAGCAFGFPALLDSARRLRGCVARGNDGTRRDRVGERVALRGIEVGRAQLLARGRAHGGRRRAWAAARAAGAPCARRSAAAPGAARVPGRGAAPAGDSWDPSPRATAPARAASNWASNSARTRFSSGAARPLRCASARRSASARSSTSASRSGTTSATPSRRFTTPTSGISASRSSSAESSARSGSAVRTESDDFSHCSRSFASVPSASRAISHASKSAASAGWSARTSHALRSRESGPIRASGCSARASQTGASAPSVTTASTRSSISSWITESLSRTAISVACGKLARATCSRWPPRVHRDLDLGPVERGRPGSRPPAARERERLGLRDRHREPPRRRPRGQHRDPGGGHVEAARAEVGHEPRPAEAHERDLAAALRGPGAQQRDVEPLRLRALARRVAERGVIGARPHAQRAGSKLRAASRRRAKAIRLRRAAASASAASRAPGGSPGEPAGPV